MRRRARLARLARGLRHPATAPLLMLLLIAALPGLALLDPVFLDSYAIRMKGHVLSLGALFRPDQTGFANPYYRPLFALLHELVDRLTRDSDLGQRLLALCCHAFAAVGLLAFARALGIGRRTRNVALILFLIAPGNVCTAAWPLVGYWTLAAGLTWFAAARLVVFVRDGDRAALATAVVLAVTSLLCSETAYQLAAFLPLRRSVAAAQCIGARGARAAAGAARVADLRRDGGAALSVPRGARARRHRRRAARPDRRARSRSCRGISRGAPAATASTGAGRSRGRCWSSRAERRSCGRGCGFLACSRRSRPSPSRSSATTTATDTSRRGRPHCCSRAGCRSRSRSLRVPRRIAAFAPLALAAVVAFQLPARIASVRTAGRATRTLLEELDRNRPLLDDLDHLVFVNTPTPLSFAIAHRLAPRTRAELEAIFARIRMRAFLCTDHAYFGSGPADLRPLGATRALVFDGGRLVERPAERPMGERTLLPMAFLARGVEVVASVRAATTRLERERRRDALLARFARSTIRSRRR